MKLSQLLTTKKIIASGFAAIRGLEAYSKGSEPVVLSSLSPAILAEQGVTEFYALVLPRGAVYNTADDIIAADLDVRRYLIQSADASGMETVIVSRHPGTVALLQAQYPGAQVLDAVTPDQIAGKHVVGTLPPHLITAAGAYTAATIRDFDYTRDGDLSGNELAERLIIADQPLQVVEVEA